MSSNSSWFHKPWARFKGSVGYKEPRNGEANSLASQTTQRLDQNTIDDHAVLSIVSAPREEDGLGLQSSSGLGIKSEIAKEEPMDTTNAHVTNLDQHSTPDRAINEMSIPYKRDKSSIFHKILGKKAMKSKKQTYPELKKCYDLQDEASYRLLLQHFIELSNTNLTNASAVMVPEDLPYDVQEDASVTEFENFVSSKIPTLQNKQLKQDFMFATPRSLAVISRPLNEKSFTQIKYSISQKKDEDNRKKMEVRRQENEQKMASRVTPLQLASSELPESSRKLKEDMSRLQKYFQPDFVKNLTSYVDNGKEQKMFRLCEYETKIQETKEKRLEVLSYFRKALNVAELETPTMSVIGDLDIDEEPQVL